MWQRFRPARFIAVGALNTLVGLAAIFLCLGFGIPALVANTVGYATGFLFSFWMHRTFTFEHRGAISGSMPRFALVTGLSYVLNVVVLVVTIEHAGPYLSQLVAVAVYATAQYLGSWLFAFRDNPEPPKAAREMD